MVDRPEDRAPEAAEEQKEAKSEERRGKRTLLWLVLGLLSLLLLVNLIIAGYYLVTKKPLNTLPAVGALTFKTPPRFLFAIYGASKPLGVAASPDGQRIYVSESSGEHQVRVFDRSGKPLGFLTPPNANPLARQPFYLATDRTGRVFVADRILLGVHIYGPDGTYLGPLTPPTGLDKWAPLGVATDRQGQVYVTEAGMGRHDVAVYDADLRFKLAFGSEGEEAGKFSFPNGLAADDQGRIFVANGNNGRVDAFGPDGKLLTDLGQQGTVGKTNLPRGVALDDQNRLYVVDTTNSNVLVFNAGSPKFEQLFTFGGGGIGDGQFRYPIGVAVDPGGRIYVADAENDRVQVWVY